MQRRGFLGSILALAGGYFGLRVSRETPPEILRDVDGGDGLGAIRIDGPFRRGTRIVVERNIDDDWPGPDAWRRVMTHTIDHDVESLTIPVIGHWGHVRIQQLQPLMRAAHADAKLVAASGCALPIRFTTIDGPILAHKPVTHWRNRTWS